MMRIDFLIGLVLWRLERSPDSGDALFEFQTRLSTASARTRSSLLSTTTMSLQEPASVSPLPEGITDPNYKPLPGRLGNLTPGQQHALDTLKRQLVSEGHFVPERMDDATLLRCVVGPCTHIDPSVLGYDRCLMVPEKRGQSPTDVHSRPPPRRFLRARKFDLVKAKAMLLSAEQWRKDLDVEDIVE